MIETEIKLLTTFAEYDACVDLQQQTWQYSAGESLPRRVFFLAEKLGGHVLGAFDGDRLVSFNLGLPAQRAGVGYIHSQMLAVLPEYRNSGLGRRMKLVQRDLAMRQGIRRIEWTYDPLEIKNSFFNLARLGAISRRYQPDFYGASSSPLQGGLPTDRLYAEWCLETDRTERILRGEPAGESIQASLKVPADIYEWKAAGDTRARQAQDSIRDALQGYFAAGLAAIGYEREPDGTGVFLLGDLPQEDSNEDR
ncbi:MAG: GNAT family N-acetyltransferase [Janthinobacterium lividum]